LANRLLAFGRRQVLHPEVLNLHHVIEEMKDPLQRLLGKRVRLVVQAGSGPCRARLDRAQLEQAVMNIVINARDAMPDGGAVTIRIRKEDGATAPPFPDGHPPPGDVTAVSIEDTGTGMAPDVLDQVFEPFFTTKEVGKGTGLGLSIVYGFVRQSGGAVAVQSVAGQGSTFTLYFPAEDALAEPVADPASPRSTDGSATILVVEDDDAVRELLAEILRGVGYTVLEARDPDDAQPRVDDTGTRIDVLITDAIMPGRSGPELALAMLQTRPDLRVCIISGFAAHSALRGHMDDLDATFLSKPFSTATLLDTVRDLLDRP
jgi:two-component system cell cycle sensor histidine kinase/response regulator CckA